MAFETRTALFPARALGFLRKTKGFHRRSSIVLLFVILNLFVSCKSGIVLGLTKQEVLDNLKTQNIDFILEADLDKMDELKKLHPSAPFYIGLLVKEAGDLQRAKILFEEALESPSAQVRRASTEQLLSFVTEKNDLVSLLNNEHFSLDDFSSWNAGFSLLASLHTDENLDEAKKQSIRDYFLSGTIDNARVWAFTELQEMKSQISPSWISSAEIN
ncbi:MAG: hypothetical protein LBV20_00635, partial [Treponema sp.]|nr:hypothetical protein [Treponema sp.]